MGSIATSRKCSVSVPASIMIDSPRSHLDDRAVIWVSAAERRLGKIQIAQSRTATSARHCSLLQNVIWDRAPHLFGDKLAFTVIRFIWWPQVHKQVKSWEPEQWELLLLGENTPHQHQTNQKCTLMRPIKSRHSLRECYNPSNAAGLLYNWPPHFPETEDYLKFGTFEARDLTGSDRFLRGAAQQSLCAPTPGGTSQSWRYCVFSKLVHLWPTVYCTRHATSGIARLRGRASTGSDYVTAAVAAEYLWTDCVNYVFSCISSSTDCCIAGNWTGFSLLFKW